MTGALQAWLRACPIPARGLEGRMTKFRSAGTNLGHVTYDVLAVRGGFVIGTVVYSNQWGYYSFRPADGVPFNREILAEIYAFLKARGA